MSWSGPSTTLARGPPGCATSMRQRRSSCPSARKDGFGLELRPLGARPTSRRCSQRVVVHQILWLNASFRGTRACEPTNVYSSILTSHTESHWSSNARLLDFVEVVDKTWFNHQEPPDTEAWVLLWDVCTTHTSRETLTELRCSKGDKCSFRHDTNKRAKMTQPNPSPNSFMQQSERKASRTRSPKGKSPSGRMSRWPCKDYLKGTCTNSFCEKWHPPKCLFCKTKSGCRFGEKCSHAHHQVAMLKKYGLHDRTWQPVVNRDESHDRSGQPVAKRDTRHELKHGPVGCRSSNTRQLGCVFQDMEPLKLTSILPKSSDMQKPIQRLKFTKAIARHNKIRDQNHSLGYICPGEPHQRSPNAPKFEDRSLEETEWQERGAREASWKMAKSVLILKEHERTTFFSPSENRCLPASTLKT